MFNQFRRTIRDKGQGLTEYVLILAFIAGIAIVMFGGNGNLKDTLVSTVTETNRLLSGLFSDKTDWGHMDVSKFNADNQGERLAADQASLEKLATFFIGKTEEEIRPLLTDGIMHTSGQEVLLGWFISTDTGNHFLTKDLKSDGGAYTFKNGENETIRSTNDQVFNWMLGDYGKDGIYKYSYDDTNNYLVSDYPISQYNNSNLQFSKDRWEPNTGGNGVKISLTFDKTGVKEQWKVTSATVKLDGASADKPNGSAGLTVTANAP